MKNDFVLFNNVSKKYDDLLAINDLSFGIKKGTIFGLLGSNGAGKTTLIDILTTLSPTTSGEVAVGGYDVYIDQNEVRKLLGVVFQDNVIDDELSVFENLYIHARLYGVEGDVKSKISEMLELVEYKKSSKVKVKNLSGGLKRRVEIARSLLHGPKILVLDEPSTGLDVQTRHKIWNYIKKINEEKDLTVLLTTHYLDEAHICDEVMIIDDGNIMAKGSVSDIIDEYCSVKLTVTFDVETLGDNEMKTIVEYNHTIVRDRIIFQDFENLSELLNRLYRETNLLINDVYIERPTLEKAYLNCVGKEIED